MGVESLVMKKLQIFLISYLLTTKNYRKHCLAKNIKATIHSGKMQKLNCFSGLSLHMLCKNRKILIIFKKLNGMISQLFYQIKMLKNAKRDGFGFREKVEIKVLGQKTKMTFYDML
jgi:hypothetical protein